MAQVVTTYANVRSHLHIGDIFAFLNLEKFLSRLIHRIAGGPSHVGFVAFDGDNPILIHASADGIARVSLDQYVANYPGEIWWVRPRREVQWDIEAAELYARGQIGTPYDFHAFASAALGRDEWTGKPCGLLYAPPNDDRQMCSEFVGACLVAGTYWPDGVNSAEMTPLDVCRCPMEADYHLLQGDPAVGLPGYGAANPRDWIFEDKEFPKRPARGRVSLLIPETLSAELDVEVRRILKAMHKTNPIWRQASRHQLRVEVDCRMQTDPEMAIFDRAALLELLQPIFLKLLPLFLNGEDESWHA